MQEANLLDIAHEASPYEDVVGVGLFHRDDQHGRGPHQVPQWSLVAVTESKVHIFSVRAIVPYVTVSHPRLFATIDRATTVAQTAPGIVLLTDMASGRQYQFECSDDQGEHIVRELHAQPVDG